METGAQPSRACVFCGGPADSREHVFATRLCARAQATTLAMMAGIYTEGEGTRRRPNHLLDSVTVRHVCRGCNNGWMNGLEAWFERRMGFLIEPTWPCLATEFLREAIGERRTLAHWLIKTAVTFNYSVMKGKLRVEFPAEFTPKIREGALPDYCWVDAGYSKLRTVGAAIGKCFRIQNGGQYYPSQIYSGFGFRFTVQFNHLLLRIALAPGCDVTYDPHLGGRAVRLYPAPDREVVQFPVYNDIMHFEHSVILNTGEGCLGNIAKSG